MAKCVPNKITAHPVQTFFYKPKISKPLPLSRALSTRKQFNPKLHQPPSPFFLRKYIFMHFGLSKVSRGNILSRLCVRQMPADQSSKIKSSLPSLISPPKFFHREASCFHLSMEWMQASFTSYTLRLETFLPKTKCLHSFIRQ